MQPNGNQKTLIVQGGGFRTGFSTGVLDAFQMMNYNPFDYFLGNSGGAIALSYYLSKQYKQCFEAMCLLAEDKNFIRYNHLISDSGMMNVDYFKEVAAKIIPFKLEKAIGLNHDKRIEFILTDLADGSAVYFQPNERNWIDAVIASCTLPFVTKGHHEINGKHYMDGGWSDALPVRWAYEQGARDILVIRTLPPNLKLTQTWTDYIASYYYRDNPSLSNCYENNHLVYNASIDFINNPPDDLKIVQIAPETPLRAGTYSNSVVAITDDYRRGLEYGLDYIFSLMSDENSETKLIS